MIIYDNDITYYKNRMKLPVSERKSIKITISYDIGWQ